MKLFDGLTSTLASLVEIPPKSQCKSLLVYDGVCSLTFFLSWGESAGAISASLHMLANGGNTEGLFRGAFLQSGSPIPVGDITNGQKCKPLSSITRMSLNNFVDYDAIVDKTGCKGSADTLQCLREVSYAKLKAAVDLSPGLFSYQVRLHAAHALQRLKLSTSH